MYTKHIWVGCEFAVVDMSFHNDCSSEMEKKEVKKIFEWKK